MMRFLTVISLMLMALAKPAQAANPSLDTVIDRAIAAFEVPGAVIIAVQGDHIVYARAAGVTKLGGQTPVTPETPFAIGSITKSFTAAAIAKLVDEGHLSWDDKAVKHLPELKMHDPYVTRELTVRDMLSHRSGLPTGAGDLLSWPQTDLTVEERLAGLRFLPLSRGFRARYGYSNLLYAAAGEIIARTSGLPWSEYVRRNFFEPLKMRHAVPSSIDLNEETIAWPHARIDGPIRGTGSVVALPRRYGLKGEGAAGAIYASGTDLAHWITAQIAEGAIKDGERLFSADSARQMHALHTPLRLRKSNGPFSAADPNFIGYALGWFVRDYAGEKVVYHGGGTIGGVAQMTLVPERGFGFVILTNSEETGFLRAVELLLLDHYLRRSPTDWIGLQLAADESDRAEAITAVRDEAARLAAAGPSPLPLAAYAGQYSDAWFGAVRVEHDGSQLKIAFDRSPFLNGPLIHVGGDVFRTKFVEPGMEDAYVTFQRAGERVLGARLRAISPLADFSFDYDDLNLVRVDR